jgi:hypothetical protein
MIGGKWMAVTQELPLGLMTALGRKLSRII